MTKFKFDLNKTKLLFLGILLLVSVVSVLIIFVTFFSHVYNQYLSLKDDEFIVTKVVDGDTIEVFKNGNTFKVRYIGIDTPETVKPNSEVECFGKEASEFNKNLVLGKKVKLESDLIDEDKYNRKLRYVYIAEGDNNGVMVNELLISEGYANILTIPPNTKYVEKFKAAQKKAREAGKGLWSKCT